MQAFKFYKGDVVILKAEWALDIKALRELADIRILVESDPATQRKILWIKRIEGERYADLTKEEAEKKTKELINKDMVRRNRRFAHYLIKDKGYFKSAWVKHLKDVIQRVTALMQEENDRCSSSVLPIEVEKRLAAIGNVSVSTFYRVHYERLNEQKEKILELKRSGCLRFREHIRCLVRQVDSYVVSVHADFVFDESVGNAGRYDWYILGGCLLLRMCHILMNELKLIKTRNLNSRELTEPFQRVKELGQMSFALSGERGIDNFLWVLRTLAREHYRHFQKTIVEPQLYGKYISYEQSLFSQEAIVDFINLFGFLEGIFVLDLDGRDPATSFLRNDIGCDLAIGCVTPIAGDLCVYLETIRNFIRAAKNSGFLPNEITDDTNNSGYHMFSSPLVLNNRKNRDGSVFLSSLLFAASELNRIKPSLFLSSYFLLSSPLEKDIIRGKCATVSKNNFGRRILMVSQKVLERWGNTPKGHDFVIECLREIGKTEYCPEEYIMAFEVLYYEGLLTSVRFWTPEKLWRLYLHFPDCTNKELGEMLKTTTESVSTYLNILGWHRAIVTEHDKALKIIEEMRGLRKSTQEIVDYLNSLGLKTKHGKSYNVKVLEGLVRRGKIGHVRGAYKKKEDVSQPVGKKADNGELDKTGSSVLVFISANIGYLLQRFSFDYYQRECNRTILVVGSFKHLIDFHCVAIYGFLPLFFIWGEVFCILSHEFNAHTEERADQKNNMDLSSGCEDDSTSKCSSSIENMIMEDSWFLKERELVRKLSSLKTCSFTRQEIFRRFLDRYMPREIKVLSFGADIEVLKYRIVLMSVLRIIRKITPGGVISPSTRKFYKGKEVLFNQVYAYWLNEGFCADASEAIKIAYHPLYYMEERSKIDIVRLAYKTLAEYAFYECKMRDELDEYLGELKQVFYPELESQKPFFTDRQEMPRTDLNLFDPLNYRIFVKTMICYRDIESLEVASFSLATCEHPHMAESCGYIMEVPDEDIVLRCRYDLWSGSDKTEADLPMIRWRLNYVNCYNLWDLMSCLLEKTYNEIIARMKKAKIIGIVIDSRAGDKEKRWAMREAVDRSIPVIEIGDNPHVVYRPFSDGGMDQEKTSSSVKASSVFSMDNVLSPIFESVQFVRGKFSVMMRRNKGCVCKDILLIGLVENQYSYTLSKLAACLRQQGLTFDIALCRQINYQAYQKLQDEFLRKNHYRAIEISVLSLFFEHALLMAKSINADYPGAKIVLGGRGVSLLHARSLEKEKKLMEEYSFVQALFLGDSEESLPAYLAAIKGKKDLSGLQGVTYREGKEVVYGSIIQLKELDQYPFALRSQNLKVNSEEEFESSRNCHGNCCFCATPEIYLDKRWYARSAVSVVGEIKDVLIRRPFAHILSFLDDNFLGGGRRADDRLRQIYELFQKEKFSFCERIRRAFNVMSFYKEVGIRKVLYLAFKAIFVAQISERLEILKNQGRLVQIHFQTRSDDIIRAQAVLEKAAPFIGRIDVGIECMSNRQLDRFKKGTTAEKNLLAAAILEQLGIVRAYFLLIIVPLLSKEEIEENMANLFNPENFDMLIHFIDFDNSIHYDDEREKNYPDCVIGFRRVLSVLGRDNTYSDYVVGIAMVHYLRYLRGKEIAIFQEEKEAFCLIMARLYGVARDIYVGIENMDFVLNSATFKERVDAAHKVFYYDCITLYQKIYAHTGVHIREHGLLSSPLTKNTKNGHKKGDGLVFSYENISSPSMSYESCFVFRVSVLAVMLNSLFFCLERPNAYGFIHGPPLDFCLYSSQREPFLAIQFCCSSFSSPLKDRHFTLVFKTIRSIFSKKIQFLKNCPWIVGFGIVILFSLYRYLFGAYFHFVPQSLLFRLDHGYLNDFLAPLTGSSIYTLIFTLFPLDPETDEIDDTDRVLRGVVLLQCCAFILNEMVQIYFPTPGEWGTFYDIYVFILSTLIFLLLPTKKWLEKFHRERLASYQKIRGDYQVGVKSDKNSDGKRSSSVRQNTNENDTILSSSPLLLKSKRLLFRYRKVGLYRAQRFFFKHGIMNGTYLRTVLRGRKHIGNVIYEEFIKNAWCSEIAHFLFALCSVIVIVPCVAQGLKGFFAFVIYSIAGLFGASNILLVLIHNDNRIRVARILRHQKNRELTKHRYRKESQDITSGSPIFLVHHVFREWMREYIENMPYNSIAPVFLASGLSSPDRLGGNCIYQAQRFKDAISGIVHFDSEEHKIYYLVERSSRHPAVIVDLKDYGRIYYDPYLMQIEPVVVPEVGERTIAEAYPYKHRMMSKIKLERDSSGVLIVRKFIAQRPNKYMLTHRIHFNLNIDVFYELPSLSDPVIAFRPELRFLSIRAVIGDDMLGCGYSIADRSFFGLDFSHERISSDDIRLKAILGIMGCVFNIKTRDIEAYLREGVDLYHKRVLSMQPQSIRADPKIWGVVVRNNSSSPIGAYEGYGDALMTIGIQNRGGRRHVGERMQVVKANRMNAFEFYFDSQHRFTPEMFSPDWKKVFKQEAKGAKIIPQVHAYGNPLFIQNIGNLLDTVQFASDIGARVITQHLSEPGRKFAEAMRPVFSKARDCGVKIGIENMSNYGLLNGERVWLRGEDVVRSLNRTFEYLGDYLDVAGITYDSGHAGVFLGEPADFPIVSDYDPLSLLNELDPQIPYYNVHLHGSSYDACGYETHLSILHNKFVNEQIAKIVRVLICEKKYKGAFILEYNASDYMADIAFLRELACVCGYFSSPLWPSEIDFLDYNLLFSQPKAAFIKSYIHQYETVAWKILKMFLKDGFTDEVLGQGLICKEFFYALARALSEVFHVCFGRSLGTGFCVDGGFVDVKDRTPFGHFWVIYYEGGLPLLLIDPTRVQIDSFYDCKIYVKPYRLVQKEYVSVASYVVKACSPEQITHISHYFDRYYKSALQAIYFVSGGTRQGEAIILYLQKLFLNRSALSSLYTDFQIQLLDQINRALIKEMITVPTDREIAIWGNKLVEHFSFMPKPSSPIKIDPAVNREIKKMQAMRVAPKDFQNWWDVVQDVSCKYWQREGMNAFFEVPYRNTANWQFICEACFSVFMRLRFFEQKGLLGKEEKIYFLDIGPGNGLSLRRFLDEFERLCLKERKDYYQRLGFVLGDISENVLSDIQKRGILGKHQAKVEMCVLDALSPALGWDIYSKERVSLLGKNFMLVRCNYLCTCLLATMLERVSPGVYEIQKVHMSIDDNGEPGITCDLPPN
ncbi:MAG: TIM barrel protein [Candidatus Omnitrophota bacterium]